MPIGTYFVIEVTFLGGCKGPIGFNLMVLKYDPFISYKQGLT